MARKVRSPNTHPIVRSRLVPAGGQCFSLIGRASSHCFAETDRLISNELVHSRAALPVNEERFRHFIEGVRDYAMFLLDQQGRVMTWNIGAERIKGYSADEIIGRTFHAFYPAEAVARGWPNFSKASRGAPERA